MRALAGVTYAEMARHPRAVSEATLKRVASDRGGVPRWCRVDDYLVICAELAASFDVVMHGAPLRELWVMARREERNTLYLRSPRPKFIRDQADLSHALYALYEDRGAPPLRNVQEFAGGAVHLPLATAARIVKRQALPADENQYMAFLRGCWVSERQAPDWLTAWEKVMLNRDSKVLLMGNGFLQGDKITMYYGPRKIA